MIPKTWTLMTIQTNEDIIAYIETVGFEDENFILFGEFPTAFIGIAETRKGAVAVYSYWKMVDVLVQNGYEFEEACEFVDDVYEQDDHGDATPIIMEVI